MHDGALMTTVQMWQHSFGVHVHHIGVSAKPDTQQQIFFFQFPLETSVN